MIDYYVIKFYISNLYLYRLYEQNSVYVGGIMYWVKCGEEISDNALFCRHCGAKTRVEIDKGKEATKQTDGTWKTGSFTESISNSFRVIGDNIRDFSYNRLQLTSVIMVIVAVLLFMPTFVYRHNWIMFLGCLYLGLLCLLKEKYNSLLMAIAFSIILGKEMITNIVLLGSVSSLDVEIVRIVLELIFMTIVMLLYWLLYFGVFQKNKGQTIAIVSVMIVLAFLVIIRLCFFFLKSGYFIVSSFGYVAVLILFILMIIDAERDIFERVTGLFVNNRE